MTGLRPAHRVRRARVAREYRADPAVLSAGRPPRSRKDLEAPPPALRHTPRMPSDGPPDPTSPGSSGLDFWLGEWICTWDGGEGRNSITRELRDAVVVERFESLEPERWSGMSVNVFDELHGWRQTWVDSTGNYWALQGRSHPEGFAFAVDEVENGRDITKRMVFSDIQGDAFRWRWERLEDGGTTWSELWVIDYRRAGA
jgi:hypothetical protein